MQKTVLEDDSATLIIAVAYTTLLYISTSKSVLFVRPSGDIRARLNA
jgi:hypothetical protein